LGNTNRRDVSPDGQGGWKVTSPDRVRPTAKAPTQSAAERVAKTQTTAAGGGQVYVHRPNGQIRDADTVKPGNESKTRDTRH
jgi:hypothetical protein